MPADVQPTVSCLYTTVQNVSDKDLFFGFLGRHGATVEAGHQYTQRGDLNTLLAGRDRDAHHQALERAVNGYTDGQGNDRDPVLAIVSSPQVYLHDATTHLVKALRLNNNSLGIADPCWDSSVSIYP